MTAIAGLANITYQLDQLAEAALAYDAAPTPEAGDALRRAVDAALTAGAAAYQVGAALTAGR